MMAGGPVDIDRLLEEQNATRVQPACRPLDGDCPSLNAKMMNHQSRMDQIEHPKVIKVIGHDIVVSDLQAWMTDLIEPLDVDVGGDDLSEATFGQQEQGSRAAPGADLPAPAAARDTDAIKPRIRRRIEGTLELLEPSSRHVDGAGTPDVLVLTHLQPPPTANDPDAPVRRF